MDRELRNLERHAQTGGLSAWINLVKYWIRINQCNTETLPPSIRNIIISWFRERIQEGLDSCGISHTDFDEQETEIILENAHNPNNFYIHVYRECQIPLEEPVDTPAVDIQNTEMGNIVQYGIALNHYFLNQPWCVNAFRQGETEGERWFYVTSTNVTWGFMQPEITYDTWDILETQEGTLVMPAGFVSFSEQEIENYINTNFEQLITEDDIRELAEENFFNYSEFTKENIPDDVYDEQVVPFIEDWVEDFENPGNEVPQISAIERRNAWGARLSAPGYMDATDWSLHPTEAEAITEITADPESFTGDLVMDFTLEANCSLILEILVEYINSQQ